MNPEYSQQSTASRVQLSLRTQSLPTSIISHSPCLFVCLFVSSRLVRSVTLVYSVDTTICCCSSQPIQISNCFHCLYLPTLSLSCSVLTFSEVKNSCDPTDSSPMIQNCVNSYLYFLIRQI